MAVHRPATPRLADAVAANLETRILEGSLKPGDRLPAERTLALELNVSRPSLREAIQKLVSKGLLTTRHGGGTYVTDSLEAHFVDPWRDMLQGHPMLQRDLLEFRQMLEGQTAYLAADRATDLDIQRIASVFEKLDSVYLSRDLAACIEADFAFHQAIAEAAHNVLLGHLSASLMRVIQDHIANNLEHLHARPRRWDQIRGQHQVIWEAIRDRKPEKAAQAARAHIEFVRQSMDENALADERRLSALRRSSDRVEH